MHSYTTLTVLALAASSVSPALSAPVHYTRQVREQSLSHRQEGAVVADAAKATKKSWGPFMKKLAVDLGIGTASTLAGIAILNKITGPSSSSSSSTTSTTPTTDPNSQYTQGYPNSQYPPNYPNTGYTSSNPNTYAPSNPNTGYTSSNPNAYPPSNPNTGYPSSYPNAYAPSNPPTQNYARRATQASNSSNPDTGAYSTDSTDSAYSADSTGSASTNSNCMYDSDQDQAGQQQSTDTGSSVDIFGRSVSNNNRRETSPPELLSRRDVEETLILLRRMLDELD